MIKEVFINLEDIESSFKEVIELWKVKENKIIVTRSNNKIEEVKSFYENFINNIGKPYFLAEDATIKDRNLQRTGELWSEVRYDSSIKDAYRHSSNAQPLHTDGSYIPSFPNATLMCCNTNTVEGGETIFLDANDLIYCLEQENKELLESLSNSIVTHARSGDQRIEKVIDLDDDIVKVNWNYYCLGKDESNIKVFLEQFFSYLQSSDLIQDKIQMVKTGTGDAMIWKDNEILHGRNGFKTNSNSQRHLYKCALDVGNFG